MIFVDTSALVQHRLGMEAVRALCADILPALDMHWTSTRMRRTRCSRLIVEKVSLVHCSSFHVMRSRMMRTAFAFDPHLREQGFEVLPASLSGNDKRDP